MSRTQRKYDHEYKVQAVKLAREIGGAKAAKELGIPEGTIHTWLKAVRAGTLDIGDGAHTPESAMSLAEELAMLRKRVKDQLVAHDVTSGFQLPQRITDGVHALLADFRKATGGIVPVIRQGQHHGKQPLGLQRQFMVPQVMIVHYRIVAGSFNPKDRH